MVSICCSRPVEPPPGVVVGTGTAAFAGTEGGAETASAACFGTGTEGGAETASAACFGLGVEAGAETASAAGFGRGVEGGSETASAAWFGTGTEGGAETASAAAFGRGVEGGAETASAAWFGTGTEGGAETASAVGFGLGEEAGAVTASVACLGPERDGGAETAGAASFGLGTLCGDAMTNACFGLCGAETASAACSGLGDEAAGFGLGAEGGAETASAAGTEPASTVGARLGTPWGFVTNVWAYSVFVAAENTQGATGAATVVWLGTGRLALACRSAQVTRKMPGGFAGSGGEGCELAAVRRAVPHFGSGGTALNAMPVLSGVLAGRVFAAEAFITGTDTGPGDFGSCFSCTCLGVAAGKVANPGATPASFGILIEVIGRLTRFASAGGAGA